jgi:hypothetical protein
MKLPALQALVLMGGLLISLPAKADPVDVLFGEGVAAAQAGQIEVAYEKLKAAWALRQTYDIAASLAVVEAALNKHRDAAEHFQFALDNFPPMTAADKRQQLEQGLAESRKKVGELTIDVAAGAEVEVNGRMVGVAPLKGPVFVEPGQTTVTCKKKDFGEGQALVQVNIGEAKDVKVEIRITTGGEEAEKPIWPTIVLSVVGAAGIGAGIGLTVVAFQKNSEAEDLAGTCGLGPDCVTQGDDLIGEANTFVGVGGAMFGLGGAALLGVLIYNLVPADSTTEKAAIVPIISPSEAGLSATLRF